MNDDREPMKTDKLHSIADLLGKDLENLTNDRFKIKAVYFSEKVKGTFDFKIVFHDVTNPNSEMIYKTTMTVSEYLVKQLTRM